VSGAPSGAPGSGLFSAATGSSYQQGLGVGPCHLTNGLTLASSYEFSMNPWRSSENTPSTTLVNRSRSGSYALLCFSSGQNKPALGNPRLGELACRLRGGGAACGDGGDGIGGEHRGGDGGDGIGVAADLRLPIRAQQASQLLRGSLPPATVSCVSRNLSPLSLPPTTPGE
jgi:hypothetical protein